MRLYVAEGLDQKSPRRSRGALSDILIPAIIHSQRACLIE
jgi:hypothetical protein